MNNNTRSIELIHKFIDIMIIQFAWWASYYIRFSSNLIPLNGSPLLLRYIKFSHKVRTVLQSDPELYVPRGQAFVEIDS